ncbi:hypothetical protein E4U32_006457 [Claviceps aff. humidiphila group G2b]|nr:hypothetical protein E4U32_006457 [Claviceps aff. humidiphila group G2b]
MGRRILSIPALLGNSEPSELRQTRSASTKARIDSHAISAASSITFPTNSNRSRVGTSANGDLSVSSGSTSLDLFSGGELSTPGTSKVPTPVTAEGSAFSKTFHSKTSLEVSSSGRAYVDGSETDRALRSSVYSLNPTRGTRGHNVGDSGDYYDDDDDSLSDMTRDAKIARRLQEEEYAKADENALSTQTLSQNSRQTITGTGAGSTSTLPTRDTPKRGRTSRTHVPVQLAPPAKKRRTIPDSEGSQHFPIDLDDEISAAAAVTPDDRKDGLASPEDGAEIADGYLYTDDEPLSKKKKGKQAVKPKGAKANGQVLATTGLGSRSGHRPRVAWDSELEEDSEGELYDQDDQGVRGDALVGAGPMLLPPRERDTTAHASDPYTAPHPLYYDLSDSMADHSTDSTDTDDLSVIRFLSPGFDTENLDAEIRRISNLRRGYRRGNSNRAQRERDRLESHHPEILTMWDELEKKQVIKAGMADQPKNISRQLKPFQLEGLAWMKEMEKTEWKGGLLGDEMGLGKTIQAVSLIMSDYPAKQPSLVLVPPVALMQWQSEIKSYTDGTLKTFVYHGTNQKAKTMTVKDLKAYDVIMMSYNSLESMYRKQEKGFTRKEGIHKEKSVIHAIKFHRIILDEAHCIKTRSTMTAKACFALQTEYRWCLSGTPLQNRIGEFFSLIRFLNIRPFALYLCKQCPCSTLEWSMGDSGRCSGCKHPGMQHVSVFNQELLNPIQRHGNQGLGREAFGKLRLMTDRIMLRRLKKDHTDSMELPVKEVHVDRQFFGEEENDFANSIMTNGQRKFDTYVAQGVLLNNYANIFGLIMQMRQVADHPDLLLKKNADGGQNVLVCCICDEPAEDTIRSRCKHDFCRACVSGYVKSTDTPDCPSCHIALSIDLEQPEIEQDGAMVKKSSIINRIKMENWVSSSKIELLVHDLHQLRSNNASHKSIIFSQFTTMLQLIEWRLRRAGITTVMLDGSMTPAQRQASIEHFMTNVDVECFLVSLKAGGVALNLTEASRVFIVDPWWNPAAEWQSADRCHRIGQTRPCTITRLCIEDSVESRMVLIQEKKAHMIHSTINGDKKAMESLTPQDMQFLFRGT